VRLAAVQATYVLMDREATIDRVAQLTSAAAKDGAQVIVFPEVFVPGTPIWIDTRPIWDGDGDWFRMLAENAVVIPSPAADRLGAIAREHEVWLVVGVEERERHGGTIYNTLLYFSPEGSLVERHRKLDRQLVVELDALGLSSIANLLAAIKTAKRLALGPDDAILSVATDSAAMYGSERRKFEARHYAEGFAEVHAGELAGRHLDGLSDDHLIELGASERRRIFNLGYYTWVEQQGVPLAEFERRRDQGFWQGLKDAIPKWDALIEDFNRETGLNRAA